MTFNLDMYSLICAGLVQGVTSGMFTHGGQLSARFAFTCPCVVVNLAEGRVQGCPRCAANALVHARPGPRSTVTLASLWL